MDEENEDQAVDEGIIRCICDIADDDGYTICCEVSLFLTIRNALFGSMRSA
jgi:hypothetical protein